MSSYNTHKRYAKSNFIALFLGSILASVAFAQIQESSPDFEMQSGENRESMLDSSIDSSPESSTNIQANNQSKQTNSQENLPQEDLAKQNLAQENKPKSSPTSLIERENFSLIYTGWVESFSKIGFNNQSIDDNLGKYPTDSFSAMVGSFGLKSTLKSQIQTLDVGLSVTAGAFVYDSTSKAYPGAQGTVMDEYIGMWRGYDAQDEVSRRHYYVVNNAYLDYGVNLGQNARFYLKGGRYESNAEYMSGYTQGFEVGLKLNNLNLWWFSSYGRAFAYGQWLVDFYSPRGYMDNGKFVNNGIHAFKATYNILGLSLSPAVYFSKGTYIAPIIEAKYDTKPDFDKKGFRSQTTLHFMNPLHESRVVNGTTYRYGDLVEKSTQTLYFKQRFDIQEYNFGLGIYKNFGNANAYIGTIGNPISLDMWTTTAYDLGRNISDLIGKNAITPFIFVGGSHFGDKLSWNLISRYSDSSRSEEASVAGSFAYAFVGGLKVGVKLEWLSDTTKAGYRVGSNGTNSINTTTNAETIKPTKKRTDDRSHSFIWVRYEF